MTEHDDRYEAALRRNVPGPFTPEQMAAINKVVRPVLRRQVEAERDQRRQPRAS